MPTNEVNHTDKEWRFHDIDLSAQAGSGAIQLKFEIKSDQGLALGGWTIDDVCIVTAGRQPERELRQRHGRHGRECDDGNTTDGDGCSATCQDETGTARKTRAAAARSARLRRVHSRSA